MTYLYSQQEWSFMSYLQLRTTENSQTDWTQQASFFYKVARISDLFFTYKAIGTYFCLFSLIYKQIGTFLIHLSYTDWHISIVFLLIQTDWHLFLLFSFSWTQRIWHICDVMWSYVGIWSYQLVWIVMTCRQHIGGNTSQSCNPSISSSLCL